MAFRAPAARHWIFASVLAAGFAAQLPVAQAGTGATVDARRDFIELCADCHNGDARGNGPLTRNLSKVPPDLTRIKQRAHGTFDEKAVFD